MNYKAVVRFISASTQASSLPTSARSSTPERGAQMLTDAHGDSVTCLACCLHGTGHDLF